MAGKLAGRVVVIVGATGGIGRVVAREFHDAGANVVLAARDKEKLAALRDELGKGTHSIPTDASDGSQVVRLFKQVKAAYGRLDVVVVAVGTWDQLAVTDSVERADELFRAHFAGMQLPSQLTAFAAAKFLNLQGLLAVVSSHVAVKHLPDNLSYGSAKAGTEKFLADFGQDLLQTNLGPIRITVLRPWTVNTPDNLDYILGRGFDPADAVQPGEIATWLVENSNNLVIPSFKEFKAKFEL